MLSSRSWSNVWTSVIWMLAMTTNRKEMHVLPEHLFAITTGYEDEVVHGFANCYITVSCSTRREKEDTFSLQTELLVKRYQALEYVEQCS